MKSRTGRKARNVYLTDEEFEAYKRWILRRRQPSVFSAPLSPEEKAAVKGFVKSLRYGSPWLRDLWLEAVSC